MIAPLPEQARPDLSLGTVKPSAGYLRVLSRYDATLLVTGSIIGAGVFFTPNDIAHVVQTRGSMLGVWLMGGLIALAGALTYAELGGLFPRAGGVYVFLREAFGGLPGFLYGWTLTLVIAPGALALVAGFFAANLRLVVPGIPPAAEPVIGVGVILLLTVVNIRGVRLGSSVQNVFTLAKLLAIALLIVGGFLYGGQLVEPMVPEDVPVPPVSRWAILLAMMPVLFSYGGWQNGTYVAAEVKRPERDVPAAVILGTLIVIASYVLINAAYLRVLTPGAIGESRTFAARAAEAALGPAGGLLVTVGILVSSFGICAAMLLTNPRVTQAVGEDGLFFAAFGRLHAKYRTPYWAIAVTGLWASVLLCVGQAGQVLNAVVFADWVFFAATAATLFVFRHTHPDAARPYRCALYPWVPLFFVTVAVGTAVVAFVHADLTSRLLGPGILALGVPVYLWFKHRSPVAESV